MEKGDSNPSGLELFQEQDSSAKGSLNRSTEKVGVHFDVVKADG